MKRVLLLSTIGVLFCVAYTQAQNVFDPADPIVRYNSSATPGSASNPNPNQVGLQKWVSVASNGVSFGSNNFDASSFKAYYIYTTFGGGQMPFRLKFPKSYTNPDSAGKKYPIMIFFHGAGEPGCPSNGGLFNNERQLLHGGKLYRDRVDNGEFDGFLLYPQNLAGSSCWGSWGTGTHYYLDIVRVIDSMAKYARADVDKVMVDGLSDGGSAAWNMATYYPTRVTKAAPTSAATAAPNISEYVHIPFWFASGGKDSNPKPATALGTYNNIKNAGGDITYTLFADLGHACWYEHWQLPGFVNWMNDMHKANPLIFFQHDEFCPDSAISARIGITPGFVEYEWRKENVLIATAVLSGSTYNLTQLHPEHIISFTGNEITVRSFGTYSVRFRRIAGGEWSSWSPKPAVIRSKIVTNTPPITVDGLHSNVLPAPDGSTTSPLILPAGYTKYEWYRNNSLLDTGRRFNAIPGLYKAKTYEPFGCGSIFSPEFTVVAASGLPKPDPAIDLTAKVEDLVNIRLHWNQNPNAGENETGFEIYRSTGGSGGPYELLAITPQDASDYLDTNRASNTTFYYVVRAVGNFGAAVLTNEASASTPIDNMAPTAPSGLTMPCITREKVTLRWNPSTDNLGVAVYDIYVNGEKWYSTTNTRFEVSQLEPHTEYAFTVKAKDAAGNSSQPSNQVSGYTRAQGLCYKVYQGDWDLLPDFNSLTPIAEGMSDNVTLSVRPAGVNDHFGILWEGHLFRTSQNVSNHRFRICSDDGSRFYFNSYYNPNSTGTLNHDGLHSQTCIESSSNISLSSDTPYPIALAFFEKGGGEAMSLLWQIRSNSSSPFTAIPDEAFTESPGGGSAPAAPGGLSANAASYNQINLSWTDNSNNETGFEIVRATAAAGPFLPLATVTGNTYIDTSLNVSTAYWYQVRSVNLSGQSAFSNTATATTQVLPPGPTDPTNLVASSPALATVQLTWNDNSNNETGFEVWRSAGDNTSFQLLTTVPGGAGSQKGYVDGPVFANVHYYYKVRAAGSPTPSGYTGEATISTANTAPELSSLRDFTVRQGTSVSVPVNATDVDGDPLTFSAPGLPFFAHFQTVSNGNANLVVTPPPGEQGGYTLRLIVSDGFGGKDTVRFTIIVNDNNLPSLDPISDVTINEGDSVFIPVTATDAEMSQYFTWSFKNQPSFASFTNNGNGNGIIKLKPGFAASGMYNMSVVVNDGFGAWTSRSFNIIVVETNPNESINVNMGYFTNPLVAMWNEVPLGGATSFNVGSLKNRENEVTTVGIRSLGTGVDIAGSGQGMTPGNGVFPDPVMRTQLKVGFRDNGIDTMQMEVYGLDPLQKYNFVFFASDNGAETWRPYNASTVTTWSINGITASVHVYQNTHETDTIYLVSPDAQGKVIITMKGDPAWNIGAIMNALVIERQYDDGTTPAKPTNFAAQVIPNTGVRLVWNDVAYNENSYRVYRSTSPNGPYTALTPDVLRDSVSYLDNTTAPFTQYYYYVRGVNHLGLGVSSDTVDALTGNNNPVFTGLSDISVKTGAIGQNEFSVSDNAGDVLTVSLLNQPSYVTLTSLGGNNYRITASPTIDDIGWDYITVEVKDDKGGSSTRQLGITVADAATRSVYINFGYLEPAPAPWNNILGYGNMGTTLNNLRDESNAATPFGVTLVDGWDGIIESGQRTGNNSGVFPDSVIAGGYAEYSTDPIRVRFTGLNPSMRYNIALMASQNEGASAVAYYSTTGSSDTLDARNNSNGTANLNNLTPDANGWITVTMTKASASKGMYLSGAQLEEFAPSSIIRQPLNLYVEAEGRTRTNTTASVALSWSDRSSNERGFTIQRATDSLFTQNVETSNVFQNLSSLVNKDVTANLSANTRYWYRVRAFGTSGAVSDWSNRVKVITPQNTVFINFNFSVPDGPAPWNNTEALPNFTTTFGGLVNQSGQPTSMTMSIEKIFNGENAFGLVTGDNSGVVPDNVMKATFWIDRGQVAEIRLRGLNQNKRYRIGFTGGMGDENFKGEMTMSYTINGRSVYLNSMFNTTKMVWIGDIVPNDAGEILMQFSTPLRETIVYGFVSAIIVQSYDDPIGGQVPNQARPAGNPEVVLQTNTINVPEATVNQQDIVSKMYPNPFRDVINLDFNNTAAGNNIAVDVYDMTGRLVYRRNFGRLPAGYNTVKLNTAEGRLNTGVYIVTLNVNGKPVQTNKMIKDKR